MRIIGGTLKSRKLKTLKGDITRPSSDRLKEAVFNRIGPYFNGGRFLDVFSGSGAIGFEAISRGIEKVDLIEKNPKAQRIILENMKDLKLTDKVVLYKGDAQAVLKTLNTEYDIIFMDPPYDYEAIETVIHLASKCLKEEGMMLVETDKNRSLPDKIGSLYKKDERLYGLAKITIY